MHEEQVVYARANRTPWPPMASMLGVSSAGWPSMESASPRIWSGMISRMFGLVGAPRHGSVLPRYRSPRLVQALPIPV